MSVCACVRLFCKMAVTWRAAVLDQAELVSDRLRQLASSGLLFLHNEFGLDLGLNPELWPCWVVLSAALVGILVAVWGVAACGGAARRRRGAAPREKDTVSTTTTTETGTDNTKTPPTRAARTEEPKKKSKKKPGEKVRCVFFPPRFPSNLCSLLTDWIITVLQGQTHLPLY